MARIKLGAIVTQISGKLGDSVYSRNASGAYIKTNAIPFNPKTAFQITVRDIMGTVSSTWSTLTDANRESWHSAVNEFSRTDQFGDIKILTGKSLFQSLNQNLLLTGQLQIVNAPISAPVPDADLTSANGDAGTQTIDIEFESDTTGSIIQLFATPPLSQGINYVKNRFRKIDNIVGGPSGSKQIGAAYVARFGAFLANDNIHFSTITINANGQASPLSMIKGEIE